MTQLQGAKLNNAVTDLIGKLKAKQGNMSETDFAKTLGMSRTMWALVKNGQREPGLDFLKAIIKAFPDLQLDVYKVMSNSQEAILD